MRRAYIAVLAGMTAAACAPEAATFHEPAHPSAKNAPEPGRKFERDNRWDVADPLAAKRLEGTKWGEQEIDEFWTRKGWRLTKHEEKYMETVTRLQREGKITKISHWGTVPFDPIYQTITNVEIEGQRIGPQTEFWMDMNENLDELKVGHPRFLRVNQYEEEHQGHHDQASDAHDGEKHPGEHHHHED